MGLDVYVSGAAALGVLGTAVVYGTDVFSAVVLRPALALVDEGMLVAVTGRVHGYGDRRMPVPGVLGIVATATTVVLAAAGGQWDRAVIAGVALAALLVWIALYTQVSAPINRQLTAASEAGCVVQDGRELQAKWDRVIGVRAALQGLAVAALCVALAI